MSKRTDRSDRTDHPDRGDLIEMNFQPAAGREIDKRRPALVLSRADYNRRAGIGLAVPLSTTSRPAALGADAPRVTSRRSASSFVITSRAPTTASGPPRPSTGSPKNWWSKSRVTFWT